MLKKIFTYGFVEGISKGLNKLVLLLLPLLISTIDYGKVGLIVSIEILIPLFSFLGLERAVLRFYSDKENYPSFLKSITLPILSFHVMLVIFGLGLYFLGFKSIFGIEVLPDIILVIILVYLQGKNNIILNVLRVEENHNNYFKGRITIQILKFILALGLVAISKNYLGYILGSIISACIANIIFSRLINHKESKMKFNHLTFKKMFSFSWPFIFHGIAINLLGNADKFIIERMMNMEKVGQYTFAYSLGTTISFAFLGISVFIEPMVYKEHHAGARERLLNKFLLYTLTIGCLFYLALALISEFFLPLYFSQYAKVLYLIPLISLCYLLIPFYFKSNYKLVYLQKSKEFAVLSIISCSINILLNIFLIPRFGLFAGVLATLISFVIQGILFNIVAEKKIASMELIYFLILSGIIFIAVRTNLHFIYVFVILCIYIILFYVFKVKGRQNEIESCP
ncbi:hypothetical protein EG344_01690 [Chryseobacterium sp. G0162]|uniref:lipopolysaccharide biosynthesis protein n=1 Tax=Chryseobacterium sp. G0162 TaxID=2487063 RepID=UPI000F4E79E8|nr:oligosaccharide flippase family protein [Chryseobacterium sp. G0162]AZB07644.1 hypothetical protein EG344_01690 [Chryseobacterium sp. G0162]